MTTDSDNQKDETGDGIAWVMVIPVALIATVLVLCFWPR